MPKFFKKKFQFYKIFTIKVSLILDDVFQAFCYVVEINNNLELDVFCAEGSSASASHYEEDCCYGYYGCC